MAFHDLDDVAREFGVDLLEVNEIREIAAAAAERWVSALDILRRS